ncbi:hypothetical protein BC332_19851 [Capsicum chinense]|nr:hypothetical protein BC332_19851 [Capsicum chinense]
MVKLFKSLLEIMNFDCFCFGTSFEKKKMMLPDGKGHANPLPSGNPHQVTCPVSSPIQMCFKILEGILYNHAKNNRKFLIALRLIFATVIGTYGHRRSNKILSLKSGSWREIDNHTRGSCSSGGLAFVRGTFHWILKDDLLKYFVISFNISNEVYGEISLPEEICNICIGVYVVSSVSILQGMLCAYCTCRDTEADTFKLWIMKDYGVKESWTKLFTMRETHLLFAALRYMFVDGEVLLYYQEAGYRRCFRTSKGPYESLDSHRGLLHGFVYTESLISPKLLIKY